MSKYRHQFLIASYHKDFPWLRQCLRSLNKFSDGFLRPVVAVTSADARALAPCMDENGDGSPCLESEGLLAEWGVNADVKVWEGPGFGRAQDAMMHGDTLCPDADYVWLLGSDCMAVEPFNPSAYCGADGRPFMLYNTWKHMKKHAPETLFWRAGVEKAFGWESKGEFMRRLPLAYPTAMLRPMRDFILRRHHISFHEYVWFHVNTLRNFSESNVMGEWAWRHAHDSYNWVLLDNGDVPGFEKWPNNPIVQHWSHGGFDRPRDQDGRTPREVIIEVLGSV